MSKTTRPLHTYDDGDPTPLDVADALDVAARVLDETAGADIHDHTDMIRSAVTLRMRLHSLVAAVNAERGEDR